MNKGTILYIGGFELPDKNAAAQRVMSNAKALRTLGYKIIFVELNRDLTNNKNIEDTKNYFEDFTCFSYKYPSNIVEWFKYLTNINYVHKFVNTNTIGIIAYNYPGLALLKLLKKYKKIKIIADCTEWYQPKGNFIYVVLKKIDNYLRMQIAHKKVYAVIAISNYLNDFYNKFDVNTINVPPLVDLDMNKWQNLNYTSSDDSIKLIYCGSPGSGGKDKLDFIIEIVSRLIKKRDFKIEFTIVGLTLSQYLENFGAKNNITKKIIFKGRIPHVDALKLIANSDFQIFLRDNNLNNKAGFPTKLVESISCGTPVITNKTSNISDFIIEGINGYLLETNSVDINVEKLYECLMQEEDTRLMKENCLNSKHFNYKNYINDFKEIL